MADPIDLVDELETLEQKVTFVLQRIDEDFVRAHDVATGILGEAREFGATMRTMELSLRTWGKFFNGFNAQPAMELNDTHDSMGNSTITSFAQHGASPASSPSQDFTAASQRGRERTGMSTPSFSTPQLSMSFARTRRAEALKTPEMGSPPRTTQFAARLEEDGEEDVSIASSRSSATPVNRSCEMDSFGGTTSPPISTPFLARKPDESGNQLLTPLSMDGSAAQDWPRFHIEDEQRGGDDNGDHSAVLTPTRSPNPNSSVAMPKTPHMDISPMKTTRLVALKPGSGSGNDSGMANRMLSPNVESEHDISAISRHDYSMDLSFTSPEHINTSTTKVDTSFGLDEEFAPGKFDLAQFPVVYRSGSAATQLTQLYGHFESLGARVPATLKQLGMALPKFGVERIELMLEMLESRRIVSARGLGPERAWYLQQ